MTTCTCGKKCADLQALAEHRATEHGDTRLLERLEAMKKGAPRE